MLAYLVVVLGWGLNPLFMFWSLETVTPIGITFGRSVLAAVALLFACLVTRTRLPPRALWPRLIVYSLLVASIPWMLVAVAINHTETSIVGIIGATMAIWVFIINLLFFPEQRPTPLRVAGIFLGFIGILIVIGAWNGIGSGTAIGVGAATATVVVFAFSLPYSHRYLTGGPETPSVSPISLSAATFVLASVETLPFVLIFGGTHGPVVPSAAIGVILSGTVSSGLVVVLTLYLVKQTDSTTASSMAYLTPLITVAAGALVLGETLTWYEPVGGVVVLLGAALAQGILPPGRHRGRGSKEIEQLESPATGL